MKSFFPPILFAAIAFFPHAITRADEAAHRKAAESLMTLIMEPKVNNVNERMISRALEKDPKLARYEEEMKNFQRKYTSWSSLKDDILKLCIEEFTESELGELNEFYRTPVGQKGLQRVPDYSESDIHELAKFNQTTVGRKHSERMPVLIGKGLELAPRKFKEHLPELQASFKEVDRKEQEKAGTTTTP